MPGQSHEHSRVGFATAASILGCSIFAVQRLTAIGKLRQKWLRHALRPT
jgi:hypothetical protein